MKSGNFGDDSGGGPFFISYNSKCLFQSKKKGMPSEASPSKGKKKGGGFLNRQKKKEDVTEEELKKKDIITPDDVLKLERATTCKC